MGFLEVIRDCSLDSPQYLVTRLCHGIELGCTLDFLSNVGFLLRYSAPKAKALGAPPTVACVSRV